MKGTTLRRFRIDKMAMNVASVFALLAFIFALGVLFTQPALEIVPWALLLALACVIEALICTVTYMNRCADMQRYAYDPDNFNFKEGDYFS